MKAAVLLLAVLAAAAQAAPRVVDVPDGQTLVLQAPGGAPQRVRLAGIEAPLPCQPGGAEARAALRDWALNLDVTVQPAGAGAAKVLGPDGADLGRRLVEEGLAWSSRAKWDRGPYVKQERMAQALKRGVHADGGVPPAQWRRTHAAC